MKLVKVSDDGRTQVTRYRARWRTPEGDSRSLTFGKKSDAERHIAAVEGDKLRGLYVDPSAGRALLCDYAAEWAASRVHRPATAARVEGDLRVHILPRLGHRPLGQLRHTEVQAFVKACAERLAPGTVENVYRTLAAMCHAAVRDRVIVVNPCEGVVLPRRPRVEVVPPTVDEVGPLLAAMPDRYRDRKSVV